MSRTENNNETGRVVSFSSGVSKISGLNGVFLHEVLLNEDRLPVALVIGFDDRFTEAVFFDEYADVQEPIIRSGEIFSIKISESIIGRVLNGSGQPIDSFGPLHGESRSVFWPAPQIIDREPVRQPLITGIKIIDTTLSLGRGQRELLVGDRKLGKSTIAADVVLNQHNEESPVHCIYVLCGQKEKKLKELFALFDEKNAFLYTTVVAATSVSSFAEKYLAPFVGCAIGEFFRDRGQDVLIVYDNLSEHAKSYRDIALLLERAPGRESYPGDIFSLHAGLLERSAKLSKKKGGGSLTALPIVETEEGDISAYIPTNLISITDGQIYFERGLFQKGFLPAINVGLSVSRVGSQAQPEFLRSVTGGLRLALAQHKELQKLAQLETTRSAEASQKIQRGELLLKLLKQDKHTRIGWEEQAVIFYLVENGYFDDLGPDDSRGFESLFLELLGNRYRELLDDLRDRGLTNENEESLKKAVVDFKKEFLSSQ